MSVRQFTFNHSLWEHDIFNNATTGYWIGEMAAASNTSYAWNGQFGQLDSTPLPAIPQLGSSNSDNVWIPESLTFDQLSLNNVVIMPPNWIQIFQGLDGSFSGPAPVAIQELTNAQRVIDYVVTHQPSLPVYIYEHWPEASRFSYPPSNSDFSQYNQATSNEYHQWFVNYQNQLRASRPTVDIRMIPVGPIIAEIMENNAFQTAGLNYESLYVDNDPHGTPNLYFLAGLITYQALFGQAVDINYIPPAQIAPEIINDFAALNTFVWNRLNHYNANGTRIWP